MHWIVAIVTRLGWRKRLSSLVTSISLISGCTLIALPPNTPTPVPTATPPSTANGWEALTPGLERRTYSPGGDYPFTQLTALRIDPAYYSFRVHYRPGDPLTLSQWREQLPSAAAFVNANFFDAQGQILGMLVADGAVYGQSFTDRGGMFQVQNGAPRIRSLIAEPYMAETLEQAAQAFPMLVLNGQPAFTNEQGDRVSRRTVIGQDSQGRVVLIVTPSLIGMRLVDISAYLPTTDLDLVNAFNLDGGGSTMMFVNTQPATQVISFDPVPAVLAVYPRG